MKHMDGERNKQMKNLSESMVSLTNALTAVISGQQLTHRSTHFQPTMQLGLVRNSQNQMLNQAGVIFFKIFIGRLGLFVYLFLYSYVYCR